MNHKIIVTGYNSPDIDGAGGAYAYAELLRVQGVDTVPVVFGKLRNESKFAFEKAGIEATPGEKNYKHGDKVILVDCCEIKGMLPLIDPNDVIEAIDHRAVHNANKEFPNAKIQVEIVGAAVTMIVEKFIKSAIIPTRESALLLYLAIASNTVNFKNKVTTKRDIEAAEYLKNLYKFDNGLVHEMFVEQSRISGTAREIFKRDKWINEIMGTVFALYQLEIVEVDEFVEKNIDEIKQSLHEVQIEGNLDFAMLTCVDLDKARNTFVVPDKQNEDLIGGILDVKFTDGVAHYPEIIMRKEIMPKIREYLIQNTTK